MNNIEGQEVEGEQGCEGARVPDYQEHVEDEVQNKANVFFSLLKVMCFRENKLRSRRLRGESWPRTSRRRQRPGRWRRRREESINVNIAAKTMCLNTS